MSVKFAQPENAELAIFVTPAPTMMLVRPVQPEKTEPLIEVSPSGRMTLASREHPVNAKSSMFVMPQPRFKLIKFVQPLNVYWEILPTLDGMLMPERALQPENALLSIVVRFVDREMFSSREQLAKACQPMVVTLDGKAILVSFWQPMKADCPIKRTDWPRETLARDVFHKNAEFPMRTTLPGSATDVREVHIENAVSAMFVTPAGIE